MLKLRLAKLGFAVALTPVYLRCGTIWPFGLPFAFGGSFDHPFVSTAIAELTEITAVGSINTLRQETPERIPLE